ncbi:MAG: hypothetical protein QOI28_2959 [Mycobacterium sp.]|nr:hypothetical protein [Mycobacterium sp.]MDT5196636.1 hypothetical protein [Mycobacterium sp.]MDT5242199.1 hypothetical protein [Mycobacterium sp.]MDT5287286.1 hypothetical protein [Mycobacterium sp.]
MSRALILVAALGLLVGCTAPSQPKTVGWWMPTVGTQWQWQLHGPIDTAVDVPVYDVDLFDVDRAVVEDLHAAGRKVICYLSAGSQEDWRPDADRFPAAVIGKGLDEWPGERWLDIRRLDVLEPIMAARMDVCRTKGFDAVEPDNVDGYANESGFPLTADDQLRYNRMLARLAHERGLGVALKNDPGQVENLVADFDFAVNEECVAYDECQELMPFIHAGKAVLHVEYSLTLSEICPVTRPLSFSSMRKPLDLTAPREPCH